MPQAGRTTFTRIRLKGGTGSYILAPVLTTTQRDALSAEEGMIIFNSTTDQLEEYDGATWQAVGQIILDTHTADLDAHTYNWMQTMRTGKYMHPLPLAMYSRALTALVADTIYTMIFVVTRAMTIDEIAIQVTTGDSGKIARLGIYADGTNLYPGALVKDYGTVSVASTAVVAASADQALTKGIYHLVCVSDGVATLEFSGLAWSPINFTGSLRATYVRGGWTLASVGSGALAATFPSGAAVLSSPPIIAPHLKSLD